MEKLNTSYYAALYAAYKVKEIKFRFAEYITSDWIYYVDNYHKWVTVEENENSYEIMNAPLDLSVLDRETKYDFEFDEWSEIDKKIIYEYAAMGRWYVSKEELRE